MAYLAAHTTRSWGWLLFFCVCVWCRCPLQVSGLCDKLQAQASEGRSDTHHLAIQLSSYQGRIKETTRKMMAIVSELSMCVLRRSTASPVPFFVYRTDICMHVYVHICRFPAWLAVSFSPGTKRLPSSSPKSSRCLCVRVGGFAVPPVPHVPIVDSSTPFVSVCFSAIMCAFARACVLTGA